jgi:hypothetical protein
MLRNAGVAGQAVRRLEAVRVRVYDHVDISSAGVVTGVQVRLSG